MSHVADVQNDSCECHNRKQETFFTVMARNRCNLACSFCGVKTVPKSEESCPVGMSTDRRSKRSVSGY